MASRSLIKPTVLYGLVVAATVLAITQVRSDGDPAAFVRQLQVSDGDTSAGDSNAVTTVNAAAAQPQADFFARQQGMTDGNRV
jgi:hypothetical protein